MVSIKKTYKSLKTSTLFKDSFWALMGNVFGRGLALLASIAIARMLGKDLFGEYGLIRTVLLTVAILSTFGLGYTSTKFIANYISKSPSKINSLIEKIIQISLIVGLFFSTIIFFSSTLIEHYLKIGNTSASIKYLAVIILFNSLTTTQIGILAGFKKFKALARINLINGIIVFVLSVVLTYLYSLDGALIALLISQIFNCIQNYVEVKKSVKEIGEQESVKVNGAEILKFSAPIAMEEMMPSILSLLIPILVVKYSNIGEVGIYNAATQWSSIILFIPGALKNVVFSHLSTENDNITRQKQILNRILAVNFSATFIPFVIVLIFSGFISDFYGSTFTGLKSVLNIAVFTTIFSCMYGSIQRFFIIQNKGWAVFAIEFISSVFIIITFIGLCNYNSSGAINIVLAKVLNAIILFTIYIIWFLTKTKTKQNVI